jgi:hypothetical protein
MRPVGRRSPSMTLMGDEVSKGSHRDEAGSTLYTAEYWKNGPRQFPAVELEIS